MYVAAPYPTRNDAQLLASKLEQMGHEVTSRWLRIKDDDGPDAALMDLEDVERCEVLLLYHPIEWHNAGTGGRHVEFGYALALGKRLVVFGRKTQNFHHLPGVQSIDRIEDL